MKKLLLLIPMLCALMAMPPLMAAEVSRLSYIQTADGERSQDQRSLVRWTHTRLVFDTSIERVAIGQEDIIELEVLGPREVLVLARNVGRTSLMVWYTDDTTETFLFGVNSDLSVLESALSDIHENIVIELAPDREALILRGRVPTVEYRAAAEKAARNYLGANRQTGLIPATQSPQTAAAGLVANLGDLMTPMGGTTSLSIAVINLLQVDLEPVPVETRLENAISAIGGARVEVDRIQQGELASDGVDKYLLTGSVQTQVDLVRILNIASSIVPDVDGQASNAVQVLADEAGSLLRTQSAASGQLGGGLLQSASGNALSNQIESNIGRAKLLSVGGGRILSMIEVMDLPQVRVSVQIHEVSRSRMKSWRPDLALVSQDYLSDSISASGNGMSVQPDSSRRIGASGNQIANALQVVGGTLSNQFQIGTKEVAFDALFSLLEREGISRSLSSPTLTVLAGEQAVFQIGGEVPVPSAFAPAGIGLGDDVSANTSGVFSGTEFRAFGVQLMVRPMVDENDRITIDVSPTISMPDTTLTQSIADATGNGLNTTAFNTRSLNTTARLQDGQPLVIGGLLSNNLSDESAYTPGLNRVPGIGKLTENSAESSTDKELVIVLTPTIIREPSENTELWEYPESQEYLLDAVGKAFLEPLQTGL